MKNTSDPEYACGMHGDINDAKTDYDDIVQAIRRTRDCDAESCLEKMAADLRLTILCPDNQTETFQQFQAMPAYAALAFRSRFLFTSTAARRKLATMKKTGEDALAEARKAGAVRIHPEAAPAWKFLMEKDPDTAWVAIRLNAMGDPEQQKYINPDIEVDSPDEEV